MSGTESASAIGASIISSLLSIFIIGYLGYWLPLRKGLHEARQRNVSPHWLWFGIYPFVAWFVWLILKQRPLASQCPTCKAALRPGDRFCPSCRQQLAEPVATDDLAIGAVSWGSGEVACADCKARVKLTASICTSCGTPAPSMECPKCHSSNTIIKSYRTQTLSSAVIILFIAISLVAPDKNRSSLRYYSNDNAISSADIIQFFGSFLLIAFCAWGIYTAFTWRAYRVRCASCGKASGPGPTPIMHPKSKEVV